MPDHKSKFPDKQVHKPRKDTAKEKQEATAQTPEKTNDWDRDEVHGDGDTVGIESESG